MKTGRPRTFDIRKEDLVRLRAAGHGRIAIAKVYGCHETTIRHWLIKFGLQTTLPLVKARRLRMDQLLEKPRNVHMPKRGSDELVQKDIWSS